MSDNLTDDYPYHDAAPCPYASKYLWKPLLEILATRVGLPGKLFEIGCGNGSCAHMLNQHGWQVEGVDPSEVGIAIAKRAYPEVRLEVGSAYDDLASIYGKFSAVISLEVVEHCYYPRRFAKSAYELLDPDGIAIISTPYHGYVKNIAIALAGKMDFHFHALEDGGHIKFWSMKTLTALLLEAGFRQVEYRRVGRFPLIATSMIAIATK